MVRRNKRPPTDAPVVAAALRAPARGSAPLGLLAAGQALFAWAWEHKARSAAAGFLAMAFAAVLLQPSDAALMARALSSRARFAPLEVEHLVERREMSAIVKAIEQDGNYVIVDGGNRVGKSVAVEVAASRLSASRTVRWTVCDEGSTAVSVLRGVFGLDAASTPFLHVLTTFTMLSLPPALVSISDIRGLVLASDASRQEPVLVVEMAGRLRVRELQELLDFAKDLADWHLGCFVFVFSPSDTHDTIGFFGSVSPATIIHVGNLSPAESMAFLAGADCDAGRAAALDAIVGGYLPHLILDAVRDYCRGALALADVEGTLLPDIGAEVRALDKAFGSGYTCSGLCGVVAKARPSPKVLDVLLQKHLIVAAMKRGVFVESRLVRAWINASCSCREK